MNLHLCLTSLSTPFASFAPHFHTLFFTISTPIHSVLSLFSALVSLCVSLKGRGRSALRERGGDGGEKMAMTVL